MAIEFIARFDGRHLSPVNSGESEAMADLTRNVDYRIVATRMQRRSVQQLRMLFALIGIAKENYDGEISTEAVKEVLKMRTGHVRTLQMMSGEIVMYPASISFEKMDQDAFNAWFPRAIDVLCRDFVPGLDREIARREIDRRANEVRR